MQFRSRWIVLLLLAVIASGARGAEIEVDAQAPFVPEGRPLQGLVITIDAGHGGSPHQEGYHGSARGVNSRVVEGDINMLVAAQVRHHLVDAGAQVHMTRWDDRKVTLDKDGQPTGRSEELGGRVDVAKQTASHLFLSLHHNATGRDTADGVVILIWPTDSGGEDQPLERAFADFLREEVEKLVHHSSEFNHYLNEHPLVTYSDMPSAVVEFGFLTNPDFDKWVSRRGAHRDEAIGVYNAVVRMWETHREELEATRRRLFPDAPAIEPPGEAKPPMAPVASSLWKGDRPPQSSSDIAGLIDLYKRTVLSDRTIFHVDVRAVNREGGWALVGAVNHPLLRDAIEQLLLAAGIEAIENELRVLPDEAVGASRHGITQIPMAMTWGQPREGASVQTQLLLGDPVYLLDRSEDGTYYLVHGADGYVGWVRREAIRLLTAAEFHRRNEMPHVRVTVDTLADDFRIPAGASLPLLGRETRSVTVGLPRGVRSTGNQEWATIPRASVNLNAADGRGEQAARAAVEFLTVPYVFGGRSRLGLDCSGLVSVSYASVGLTMPRDAFQQALVGRLVATSWDRRGLQPGDILFFIDVTGRMIHTGISLGGSRYIHASPPEVQVNSFDPQDELYSELWARHFAFARRPLD